MFACTRKDRLMTRTGSPYLALELRDRTGTLPARAFQNADALAGRFERGDLVRVRGRVERFRDELVLEVLDIAARRRGASTRRRSCRPPTATSTSSTASSSTSPARSTTAATARCSTGCWPTTRCARRGAARRARAAGHHAYLGGLLEHTVAVATLAHETCQLHPRLNSDLLLTAALVHDLGRTREFTYGAEIGLTDEGRLLGHLVIGERMLAERSRRLLDEARRLALLHCVLCHHGPARRPAGASPRPRRWRCTASTRSTPAVKGALEHGLGD